jgi:Uma2 family endonuclease
MASSISPQAWPDPDEILYPASDGKPLGETGYHVVATLMLFRELQRYFAAVPDIDFACDMFLYYEQGNPKACKAPDVMVIKGVAKELRRSFKTWVERAVPCVIFEVTSAETIQEDLNEKRHVYARLGVAEYVLFDPEAKVLRPPLQGLRLKRKKYVPIPRAADGSVASEELGLRFLREGYTLRLIDARTGERFLTAEELAAQQAQRATQEAERAAQEAQRAAQEAQRSAALEAEVARLQRQVARLKRKKKDTGGAEGR